MDNAILILFYTLHFGQGQECDSLVFLGATLGCLLATTTSTTLLIQPGGGSGGNQTINVRQLKVPAGLLGGISRKVTSLVFGSMPTQAPEAVSLKSKMHSLH